MKQTINGKMFDWSDITIKLSGLENIQPLEISYDDETEKELVYGRGKNPRGFGTGNYKSSLKLSLLRDDYNLITNYCKKHNVTFYDLVIPKIIVAYANESQTTETDILQGCTFSKRSFKDAQGDKSLKVDLDGIMYKPITSNGVKG
jgi:hypothetical protein